MAKDPAILWYWDDWGGGTMLLTRHQKGCYIDLLNAQFNNGHLSLEEIKICLGADFGPQWPALQKKFKVDPQGLYYNERMDIEISKRAKYKSEQSAHGKAGAAKRWGKPPNNGVANGNPINNPNAQNIAIGNGNGNGNSGIGGPGERELIVPRMRKLWLEHFPSYPVVDETDFPALLKIAELICKQEQIVFDVGSETVREAILRRWGEMAAYCAGDDHYSTYSIERVGKHIQSLIQAMQKRRHGNSKGAAAPDRKLGGFRKLADELREDYQRVTGGKGGH